MTDGNKATHPCPCGFFGDPKRDCRCSLVQVQRYRDRISGPLLDRIDTHLEVPSVEFREMASKEDGEASTAVRERVERLRDKQQQRFGPKSKVRVNARMTAKMIRNHCAIDEAGEGMLKMAMNELTLSARAGDRGGGLGIRAAGKRASSILKVARTIADLAEAEHIHAEHVAEAIQYRTLDRNLWG